MSNNLIEAIAAGHLVHKQHIGAADIIITNDSMIIRVGASSLIMTANRIIIDSPRIDLNPDLSSLSEDTSEMDTKESCESKTNQCHCC